MAAIARRLRNGMPANTRSVRYWFPRLSVHGRKERKRWSSRVCELTRRIARGCERSCLARETRSLSPLFAVTLSFMIINYLTSCWWITASNQCQAANQTARTKSLREIKKLPRLFRVLSLLASFQTFSTFFLSLSLFTLYTFATISDLI